MSNPKMYNIDNLAINFCAFLFCLLALNSIADDPNRLPTKCESNLIYYHSNFAI